MVIKGWIGALLEVSLFMTIFGNIRESNTNLNEIDPFVSYWLGFTVLTGFWELVYLSNRKSINKYSTNLVLTNESVWTRDFNLSMILPWNLSKLFYAEYGAWADREYKTLADDWSMTIEGSHCGMCALFSFIALSSIMSGNYYNYVITMAIAMGSQFMNSLLYMVSYFNQVHNKDSVNYDSPNFPAGNYLLRRPFMYINYLWLIFPAYAIIHYVEF